MTKKKDPSEWKVRQKPANELVGGDTKVCPSCGETINRNGMGNLAWIRKRFCSKSCSFKGMSESSWKRRMVCDG